MPPAMDQQKDIPEQKVAAAAIALWKPLPIRPPACPTRRMKPANSYHFRHMRQLSPTRRSLPMLPFSRLCTLPLFLTEHRKNSTTYRTPWHTAATNLQRSFPSTASTISTPPLSSSLEKKVSSLVEPKRSARSSKKLFQKCATSLFPLISCSASLTRTLSERSLHIPERWAYPSTASPTGCCPKSLC